MQVEHESQTAYVPGFGTLPPGGYPIWPRTPEGWCEWFHKLDHNYATDKLSPLHHDNRCPIHGLKHRRAREQNAI